MLQVYSELDTIKRINQTVYHMDTVYARRFFHSIGRSGHRGNAFANNDKKAQSL